MKGPVLILVWIAVEILVPILVVAFAAYLWLKRSRKLAVATIAVLILAEANFSGVPYALGLKNLFPVYDYVSSDGGFADAECLKSTACYWSVVQERWAKYKQEHPSAELLRKDPIRLWEFWNWYDYATHPRWRLRYAREDETPPGPEPGNDG